jgi:hypothetical protein
LFVVLEKKKKGRVVETKETLKGRNRSNEDNRRGREKTTPKKEK